MVKAVQLTKEIVVTVANKIGILANMSKILAGCNINIEAVAGYAENSKAKIMLITNNNPLAIDELKKSAYRSVKENEVVMVELENKIGALRSITEKLASERINIKYIYGAICTAGCPARIILSTNNNQKALSVLKK